MIDVLIPAYGNAGSIRRIHRHLEAIDIVSPLFIVENTDTDTVAACESDNIPYVLNTGKRSPASAYARGIEVSSNPFVLFAKLSTDFPATGDWWSTSLSMLRNYSVVGADSAHKDWPQTFYARREYVSDGGFYQEYDHHFFDREFLLTAKLLGVYAFDTSSPLSALSRDELVRNPRSDAVLGKDAELYAYRSAAILKSL
jgi:hypothetical protein